MALTKITGEGVGAVDDLIVNRSGNGVAQTIQNSGSTVGAIGIADGDNLYIASDDTNDVGLKFNGDGNRIQSCNASGANTDNAIDLGEAGSGRFKDLYLGGGISAIGVYNNTTGTGANLVVDSGGGFARSTSSQRYKNTISDATHGLTELLALRPVTYKHNGNGDTLFGGLIAEEVHAAGLTEFVDYSQDADGNDQPEALHYANMVSLCIKAIQEQQATITALTARLTALETE